MKIAVLKETKQHEYRVGMTPTCVGMYVERGHQVQVEIGAGLGAGFSDADYQAAGAEAEMIVVADPAAAVADAEMIVKVKEPSAAEAAMMREGSDFVHLFALGGAAGIEFPSAL